MRTEGRGPVSPPGRSFDKLRQRDQIAKDNDAIGHPFRVPPKTSSKHGVTTVTTDKGAEDIDGHTNPPMRSATDYPCKTLILVPGFMSPAWMLFPIQWYLRKDFDRVIRWDYPRVFGDLNVVTKSLAEQFSQCDGPVSIVSHSFGDWITRSALHQTDHRDFARLVSVCPVTTAVPIVQFGRPLIEKLTSEMEVMASTENASLSVPRHIEIHRSFVWAKGEVLIRQEPNHCCEFRERHVWASHNSILFQPNAWKVIREELNHGSAL